MIQIVFTDNGKVHTVTFSGDDADKWAERFVHLLALSEISCEVKDLGWV